MFTFHVDATTLATPVIEANGNPKRKNQKTHCGTVSRPAQLDLFSASTPNRGLVISNQPVTCQHTPHHAVALMAE